MSHRLCHAVALILCVALTACGKKTDTPQQPEGREAATASPAKTVALLIQAPDAKTRSYPTVPWREGLTVKDLLDAHKAAGVTYTATGSGETTLLTALNGASSEGGAQRNWLFWVNGQFGDKSFGAYTLKPGDTVEWRFALYEEGRK